MCRLFASSSLVPLNTERDLLSAPHSLAQQSQKHPDGWGITTFAAPGAPRRRRSTAPAHSDPAFAAAARQLAAPTLIAHVRKASVGGVRVRNTHPFVQGGWTFAHNGTVQAFDARRSALERAIAPSLRRELSGETDSERLFFLFLTLLRGDSLAQATTALRQAAGWVLRTEPPGLPKPSSVNVICSDGARFLALRLNRELVFSTGSRRQRPRRTGESAPAVVVASEATSTARRWRAIPNGSGIAIDSRRRLGRFRLAPT